MEMNPTFERISDKQRRIRYLANQIRLGLRFQLRALRKERGNMTQAELANKLGTKQTVISRVENHDADKLSIPTLLKMAEALDVGLVVRFEPIDQVVDWYDNLSPSRLAPASSEEIITRWKSKEMRRKPIATSRSRLRLIVGGGKKSNQPSIFRPIGVPTNRVEVIATERESADTDNYENVPLMAAAASSQKIY